METVGRIVLFRLRSWALGPVALPARASGRIYGIFRKFRGTSFWGPYSKDPTIQGTILGSPIFGNSHIEAHSYVEMVAIFLSGFCGACRHPKSRFCFFH